MFRLYLPYAPYRTVLANIQLDIDCDRETERIFSFFSSNLSRLQKMEGAYEYKIKPQPVWLFLSIHGFILLNSSVHIILTKVFVWIISNISSCAILFLFCWHKSRLHRWEKIILNNNILSCVSSQTLIVSNPKYSLLLIWKFKSLNSLFSEKVYWPQITTQTKCCWIVFISFIFFSPYTWTIFFYIWTVIIVNH